MYNAESIAHWIITQDFNYDREALYSNLRMYYDEDESNRILTNAERLANCLAGCCGR